MPNHSDAALQYLMQRYLGTSTGSSGFAPDTRVSGTQTQPLDKFVTAGGATGNKTTNADLPEWLKKLGMKGDAYAGGMLKPELRYGFKYKDGKIHFADGTSFAAKKVKGADGKTAYSYTGADGKASTYSPTDEQNAYNKKYKASTSNQSFFDKAKNTLEFEFDHLKQLGKDFSLNNVFFGVDPIGVKFGNALTGRDDQPLVNQYGGATEERFADYERRNGEGSLGFAPELHQVAQTVASIYGMQGLGNLANAGINSLGTANAGSGLGVFSNGGTGGVGSVGNSAMGNLVASQGGAAAGAASSLGSSLGGSASSVGGNMAWTDWIGPLISAGASIYGGKKANDATSAASAQSIAEQQRQFDLVRSDTAPGRALGAAAIGTLANLSGYNESGTPDYSAFRADPGYQFALSEGQNAIDRSAAARGGLLSGAAVKEGVRYGTGMADQQYSAFYDRLLQQAGLGNTGIGASAAAGSNAANNISATAMNAGNQRASTYMNTAANVNNSIQTGLENRLLQRYLGG